jgi:hypothetical protein
MYLFALWLLVSFSSAFAKLQKKYLSVLPVVVIANKLVFDKSGICPHCNMALIRQTEKA